MKNKFLKDALSLGLSSFKNSLFMKMNCKFIHERFQKSRIEIIFQLILRKQYYHF